MMFKELRLGIRVYCLALKYWFFDGDEWKNAKEYAEAIVKTWR